MTQTVLLTGVSGFIAKRIALDLLLAGHRVTGTLRSLSRADEVRAALRANGAEDTLLANLSFVAADLTRDDGWSAAMAGVERGWPCSISISPSFTVQYRTWL